MNDANGDLVPTGREVVEIGTKSRVEDGRPVLEVFQTEISREKACASSDGLKCFAMRASWAG